MNYQEILDYLFSQLPMYQNDGIISYKKDINNITEASNRIGKPHKKFKSIHITGTNGKGSTSNIIASILKEAGYKVGLYTSPHLKDFRERIRINGGMIAKDEVKNFVIKNKKLFKELKMSFFEMTVLMAFDYFAKKKIDIGVIEVGLGGRLDSTNIITPELAIITNISIDHTNILGSDIKEIAKEKFGIIKNNIPVVIGRKQKEIEKVFLNICKRKNSRIIYSKKNKDIKYTCDLKGDYQKENINTSITAIKELIKQGWNISEENIINGLRRCTANTGIKGRWQILQKEPLIICDTAHNQEGIKSVIKQIKKTKYKKLHFVLGLVNDKEINSILSLLPKKAIYYFCNADINRALDSKILEEKSKKYDLYGKKHLSVRGALKSAKEEANKDDLIFISGSTFVVAEII